MSYPTITEITSGFKALSFDLDLIGKPLYNHANFTCRCRCYEYRGKEFINFPEIKVTVKASDNNLYYVYLKEAKISTRINRLRAQYFYCELAKEKEYIVYQTDFRGNKVKAYTYHQESVETETPKLDRLEKINNYIKSDDLLWDFSYLESLLDEMSDKELDEFCEVNYAKSREQKLTYRGAKY
jgi:hypothetical protein